MFHDFKDLKCQNMLFLSQGHADRYDTASLLGFFHEFNPFDISHHLSYCFQGMKQ